LLSSPLGITRQPAALLFYFPLAFFKLIAHSNNTKRMGNVLPACLVQHGGATAAALSPGMKPRQRLVSLKLLVKAVNKVKTKRPGSHGNKQAKIGSKSSSSAAAVDEKGGEAGLERKVNYSSNPKGNVLRSRLHHGGHKKGVVRVKVVLSKEEAARLLTLTVGGQKTAEQVVAEIKRMELRRAANASANTWRPKLESIPEESS
jgi:hypothetical protein